MENVENILKRGFLELEDKNFDQAYEYFEEVLKIDMEVASAYVGKLMAEFKVSERSGLSELAESFEDNTNYKRAIRFGDDALKTELEGYIKAIHERNENKRLEDGYKKAVELINGKQYADAVKILETLNGYKDTNRLILECKDKIDALKKDKIYNDACLLLSTAYSNDKLEEAAQKFASVINWKDSKEKINQCRERVETLKKEKEEYLKEQQELAEKIKKQEKAQRKKTLTICTVAVALVIAVVLFFPLINPMIKYNDAKKLMENGQSMEAIKILDSLGGYKDSKEIIASYWNNIAVRETISAGWNYTVGLKEDGTVEACGYNEYGQCDVTNWKDIVSISARFYHTVGLKEDGTVVATGWNESGQCDVSDWTDIVAVSAGCYHTVGLKKDGTVVTCGSNESGQCDVSDWTDIVAVSAGYWYTVGVKADGTVVATGWSEYGQCDVSGWTDIVAVSTCFEHIVGLKADGTVVACGDNLGGQCDVTDWTDIVAVSAGFWHTVGLKADGTVVAIGNNDYGECDVSDWKDIVAVSANWDHTVGLKKDGTVIACGGNEYGQCDVTDWTNIKIPE